MNKLKAVFFCLLSVLVLSSSTNTVFADEVDDLLDKCGIAPDPKPSAMVYDYELSPDTLMPGDVGVLTITLKNMQEEPIEKDVDIKEEIMGNYTTVEETIKEIERTSGSDGPPREHTIEEKVEPETRTIDIDTETRFTMDAYIKEAYIIENEFKVYNRYISAGVIGPDEKVDLAFKIKAPLEEGVYMLKFIADIEDMEGKSSKGIRYFIPVTVSGTLNLLSLPLDLEISQNEVRLEVINEGLSDVDCVYVAVSKASGVEFAQEETYIGRIPSGESAIAIFNVIKADGEGDSANAIFKAAYKNGVNEHESNQVCVRIPCLHCSGNGEEESLLEKQSETSIPALSSKSTQALKSKEKGLGAAVAFAGLLLVPGILYLILRKRKEKGEGEDRRLKK